MPEDWRDIDSILGKATRIIAQDSSTTERQGIEAIALGVFAGVLAIRELTQAVNEVASAIRKADNPFVK